MKIGVGAKSVDVRLIVSLTRPTLNAIYAAGFGHLSLHFFGY